jgi:hypothetical protein
MATTTNYGWTTPDDTALVKDGAAAIRTLGSSVDTTTKNLNPETTLGDIAYRSSTANVKTRLGLGTAGQVLAVNSGATAPEWTTVSSGGMTSLASGSIAASVTGVDISSIPGSYKNLFLVLRNWSLTTGSTYIAARFNNDSGSDYSAVRQYALSGSASNNLYQGTTSGELGFLGSDATSGQNLILQIFDYTDTTSYKLATWNVSVSDNEIWQGTMLYREKPAIDRIQILSKNGAFDTGTYELFGVK